MKLQKDNLKIENIYGIDFYVYEGDLICKEDIEIDFNLKVNGNMNIDGKHIQLNSSIIVTGWQKIGGSQKIGESQKIGGSQEIGGWQEIKNNTIASFVFLGTAFKLVDKNYQSPIQSNKLTYKIGDDIIDDNFDSDINQDCGAGINLANWQWILKNKKSNDNRILIIQYDVTPDNICMPKNTDGKFRVKKCKVIGELPDNQIPWRIK
ncbi:MAG: hypothetical protein M0P71_17420 [Melioribacteraceae bacterium]|nr:hypothetical protein [Melioribacteraceae bacterium]